MATQLHSVTGTARWAKLFERNRDKGEFHAETDGATTIELLLDKEALDQIKKTGSRLRPKITDEGVVIKFKRPWVHPSVEAFGGAPRVVDKDDNLWDDSVSIGNDSLVEVYFTTYDTKMGKGTRLEGVRVKELVEFVSDKENTGSGIKLPF